MKRKIIEKMLLAAAVLFLTGCFLCSCGSGNTDSRITDETSEITGTGEVTDNASPSQISGIISEDAPKGNKTANAEAAFGRFFGNATEQTATETISTTESTTEGTTVFRPLPGIVDDRPDGNGTTEASDVTSVTSSQSVKPLSGIIDDRPGGNGVG